MDFMIIVWETPGVGIEDTILCETRGKLVEELKKLKGKTGDVYMLGRQGSIYQQRILYNLDLKFGE